MKSIFFIHLLNISRNPQMVLSLARQWHEMGYKVYMFTPWEKLDLVKEKFKIIRFPCFKNGHLRSLVFGLQLCLFLPILGLYFRPAIIFSRHQYLEVFPIWVLKKLINTKYLLNIHGHSENEAKMYSRITVFHRIIYKLNHFAYQMANKVTTVTPELKNYIIETHKKKSDDVLVLRNGANINIFKPINREIAIRETALQPDYRYLLFCGSFKKWHAIKFKLKVFEELLGKYKNVKLLLIGDGGQDLDSSDNEISEYIKNKKLNEHVHQFGFMPPEMVMLYINCSEVCLANYSHSPIAKYGFSPLKISEYMACAKPIVTTSIGGLGEFVKEYNCGLAANPDDINDCVEKVSYLLDNPQESEKMGNNGFKAAQEEFNWQVIAQKIISFAQL